MKYYKIFHLQQIRVALLLYECECFGFSSCSDHDCSMTKRPGGIKTVKFSELFIFADYWDWALMISGAIFSVSPSPIPLACEQKRTCYWLKLLEGYHRPNSCYIRRGATGRSCLRLLTRNAILLVVWTWCRNANHDALFRRSHEQPLQARQSGCERYTPPTSFPMCVSRVYSSRPACKCVPQVPTPVTYQSLSSSAVSTCSYNEIACLKGVLP